MAHVTDTRIGGASVLQNIAALRHTLQVSYTQYATYRNTLRELRSLSTRELNDMGLNQYALHDIAYDAAYGAR